MKQNNDISMDAQHYELQKGEIINGELVFEKGSSFEAAIEDGFFLLKIPSDLNLEAADSFAKNFYKKKDGGPDDIYKGYVELGPEVFSDPLLGFQQRKYQIEQFLLEKRFWRDYYPAELTFIGEKLVNLSADVIRNVVTKVGIPQDLIDKATGGCAYGEGAYHLTFNHYRPQMATLGLQEHRDDGFITILRSLQPGLEIFKDGQWLKLNTEPNYFKINFGLTMQMLTKDCDIPVSAVLHRVIQQKVTENDQDRWSWGHFSSCRFDSDSDRGIYSYSKKGGLVFCNNARDHINQNDSDIYK